MAFPSDVIDVEHVMDVIVLQYHVLALDQRLVTTGVESVAGGAEVDVDDVVAEAVGRPVEAQVHRLVVLGQDLDVRDCPVVTGIGGGSAGAVGFDAEYAVFETLPARVVDQRYLVVRIGGELVIVVPRRHVEVHVVGVARQPVFPPFFGLRAGFLEQERLNGFIRQHHLPPWACSASKAFFITSSQYSCWPIYRPSSSVLMQLSSGFRPIRSAVSSGPLTQWVAPRERSFHFTARASKPCWQERNSSRSSGVAMPVA